ncbi:branched-chain amino acid aminotransferase II [Crepidotus variabilis]|uniref:Branched-chain-amino-acid aminotransferase n=1 Tax=Crepidotus variabilis TaxID=179855 RepID=A0A9P6JQQ2_9AGAR|nr:branched-chain amino acid aminotransferase II [Crepidotus variabilis]
MSLSFLRLLRSSRPSVLYSPRVRDYTRTSGIRLLNNDASQAQLADIDVSKLEVIHRKDKKPQPASAGLKFGHTFSDHMLTIPWSVESGWGTPQIRPYGPLELEPSATVLHYAQTIFEGMKAYKDEQGRVTLFRPDMNMRRMNTSAARIALPTFDGNALLELIKKLVHLDKEWIPTLPGYSMYIRPTMIATQKAIGVGPPNEALLFVILCPVGPYYAGGFKPVSLYGTTDYVRAAPGGTGAFKLGVNYAPGILPQKLVGEKGYAQNLWLHGPEHYLTEVGTMNLFVVFEQDNGDWELVTPPLDGMILPGVTRDSVLTLAREHSQGKKLDGLDRKITVTERSVKMSEVKEAAEKNKLIELFGSGTAAIISPVDRIGYMGEDVHIPTGPDGMGPVSGPVLRELVGRQTGTIPSDWSVVIDEP